MVRFEVTIGWFDENNWQEKQKEASLMGRPRRML